MKKNTMFKFGLFAAIALAVVVTLSSFNGKEAKDPETASLVHNGAGWAPGTDPGCIGAGVPCFAFIQTDEQGFQHDAEEIADAAYAQFVSNSETEGVPFNVILDNVTYSVTIKDKAQ